MLPIFMVAQVVLKDAKDHKPDEFPAILKWQEI